MTEPTVSVIIPTYGDGELALSAINSVQAQTYENWRIVLVDGSDDPLLREIATGDDRITYHYSEPSGIAAARNDGVELSEGDIVAFLDADDEWLPTKLSKQISAFESGADFVYTDIFVVEDGTERAQRSLGIKDRDAHHITFFKEGGIPCSTVAVRRSVIAKYRFDTSLTTGEDRHMWIRLLRNCQPERIPEPLARYVRRSGSLTDDIDTLYDDERQIVEDMTARFPELAPLRETQLARAEYKLAKRLLRRGNNGDAKAARRHLYAGIYKGFFDYRAVALLIVTFAPSGSSKLLELLERIEQRL